jgi:NAD(P)-dependent dehydrogenase (short-subunit alcohol dehydrogenase family)
MEGSEMKQKLGSAELRLDLAGRVAVVLGASAEGGTGWDVAERLASNGAKVVVAARTLPPLERLAGARHLWPA